MESIKSAGTKSKIRVNYPAENRCPRCIGGQMFWEYDKYKCVQCGYERPVREIKYQLIMKGV